MIIKILFVTVLSFFLSLGSVGCSGKKPANLGVQNSRLAPCPLSSNCVSSQSLDPEHTIEPLFYTSSGTKAHDDLRKIILGMKRVEIRTDSGTYMHAECTSAVWRFVDDLEFYFDDIAKIIHVRSASRLGKSDFGVNRERVESIRTLWKKAGNS